MRKKLDRVLAVTLIALMGFSVINVWWQVITRWLLPSPSSFTEELARYLLIWIGTLGAAYGVGQKLHLAIDLLPEAVKGKKRHVLEIVIQAVIVVFAAAVMVVGGGRLVMMTAQFGQTSAAMGIPLAFVYSIVPISGLIIVFYAGVEIYQRFLALQGEDAVLIEPDRSTTKPID